MSLQMRNLDDRTFQQIVDEVRKRIPLYCPEWTDHNASDPGITLIELFAWMIEMMLYRLNQVPELHFIKFMEFLGLTRKPPNAAHTRVTFWLSKPLTAPHEAPIPIPSGLEVATTQTETRAPVIFTTDDDLQLRAPALRAIAIQRLQQGPTSPQRLRELELLNLQSGVERLNVFADVPSPGDTLYFGFANGGHDFSYHILGLRLRFDTKSGIGINVNYPPYHWNACTGANTWERVDLELDATRGMNIDGDVILHLPRLHRLSIDGSEELFWVQVTVIAPTPDDSSKGMRPYGESPSLLHIVQFATIGGSTSATHDQVICKELVGVSDGSPGQRFLLHAAPVLAPRTREECLRVKVDDRKDEDEELWQEVSHFAESGPNAQHYMLDSISGELRFGPAVRQPSGEIKSYGKTPPRGGN